METLIDRALVDTITSHFRSLTSLVPLSPIRSEQDYDKAVAVLNQLLDAALRMNIMHWPILPRCWGP
ncbi:hypothetical protein [Massilia aquatica]|uniref:hypothetical protein n=1 Tax=Massilia aquatica TaxID=2609000 RepID=UPI0018C87823|nr:hypothetical protein [Massilia aquatica]